MIDKTKKSAVSLTSTPTTKSILAVLFFLMGAIPLYAQFNGGGHGSYLRTRRHISKLAKIALLAIIVATISELMIFAL